MEVSSSMLKKYENSEFDFEVLPILEKVVSDIQNELDEKEKKWIANVLTLGNRSRKDVHLWKEKSKYLPGYLSDNTIVNIKELDQEADELISEGKIEDVIFYFDKLDDQEKQECVLKLKSRLNGDAQYCYAKKLICRKLIKVQILNLQTYKLQVEDFKRQYGFI